jgi:hypothetical protein
VTVGIAAAATLDLGGNALLPTSITFEYDNTFPTVDLTTQIVFPTNKTRILYTAVFSGVQPCTVRRITDLTLC